MSEFKHRRTLERREQAEQRQTEREARTDREHLALLVERGHGHCREAQILRTVVS